MNIQSPAVFGDRFFIVYKIHDNNCSKTCFWNPAESTKMWPPKLLFITGTFRKGEKIVVVTLGFVVVSVFKQCFQFTSVVYEA